MEEAINKVIKNEGYITYVVNKRQISTNGGNYLGVLFEVDVKGTTSKGPKETNIFVKKVIEVHDDVKILSLVDAYSNEQLLYSDLSQVFEKLQQEANVPVEERYKIIKCYDSNTEMLVLENVAKKGYKSWPRTDLVSLEFTELAIKELAKFHALSFVLKIQRPKYFDTKIKPLKNLFNLDPHFDELVLNMKNHVLKCVDEDTKEKIERFVPVLLQKIPGYLDSPDPTVKCLCHGDYKMNNIMMREIDGKPVDIIPVDYQILHYGSPVLDFIFYMYMSTDKEFRKDNMDDLKELYFESLTTFLRYFNLDVESVYPREEFDYQLRDKHDYGLMISIFLMPLLLTSEQGVPDFKEKEIKVLLDDKFKARFDGVIDEFVQLGYI